MSQPTPSQVHVNRPLTNISIAYAQDQAKFISTKVFPSIPVAKQGDIYFIYRRGDWNRILAEKRAPATESVGSGYPLDQESYYANVWALHSDVSDQERANADAPINPDRDHTEFVTYQHLLRREKEWSLNFFKQGVWATDREGVVAGPGGTQFLHWSDAASTPIEDIDLDIDRVELLTGFTPNKLILGKDVFRAFKNHPDVIDRAKGVTNLVDKPITEVNLGMLWGVDILIAKVIENTAAENATESNARIFNSKSALLVYSQPNPGIKKPSGGYTFEWTGLLAGAAGGATISKFRMDKLKADRIEGEMAFGMKIVATDMGVFYRTAVA